MSSQWRKKMLYKRSKIVAKQNFELSEGVKKKFEITLIWGKKVTLYLNLAFETESRI